MAKQRTYSVPGYLAGKPKTTMQEWRPREALIPEFAQADKIKDARGRAPKDVGYDPTTLLIPPQQVAALNDARREFWLWKQRDYTKIIVFPAVYGRELYEVDAVEVAEVFQMSTCPRPDLGIVTLSFPLMTYQQVEQTLASKGLLCIDAAKPQPRDDDSSDIDSLDKWEDSIAGSDEDHEIIILNSETSELAMDETAEMGDVTMVPPDAESEVEVEMLGVEDADDSGVWVDEEPEVVHLKRYLNSPTKRSGGPKRARRAS